jgi:hypothetical protein
MKRKIGLDIKGTGLILRIEGVLLRQALTRRLTPLDQPAQPEQIAVAIKEGVVEIKQRQSHQAGAPDQGFSRS